MTPHPIETSPPLKSILLFGILILSTLFPKNAPMLVVCIEELPTLLLIKRRIENGTSYDCFAEELHDSLLLVIWYDVGTRSTGLLLNETQHDMLFILVVLTANTQLPEVDHNCAVQTTQLFRLYRVEELT